MLFFHSVRHLLWTYAAIIPLTFALLFVSVLGAGARLRYRIAHIWMKLNVTSAQSMLGIKTRVSGLNNLPADPRQGIVLLSKHQSTFDVFLIAAVMPRPVAFVFKKELLKIPFFGWALACLDMIRIDRTQRRRAFADVLSQGHRLLGDGLWVTMFPEGTRMERGEVGEYKRGGSRLAVSAGVPVVPVAITSAKVWPRKAFVKRPGVVDISIGPQLSPAGRTQEELMDMAQDWIEREMQRLDPHAYPAIQHE